MESVLAVGTAMNVLTLRFAPLDPRATRTGTPSISVGGLGSSPAYRSGAGEGTCTGALAICDWMIVEVRRPSRTGEPHVFVIQAASGTAKSSDLKIGWWPPLKSGPDVIPPAVSRLDRRPGPQGGSSGPGSQRRSNTSCSHLLRATSIRLPIPAISIRRCAGGAGAGSASE